MTQNTSRLYHEAVMTGEIISALQIKNDGYYVDATLGGGGHTVSILESNPSCVVYAFDKDSDSLSHAESLVSQYTDRLHLFHENFVNFRSMLALERINNIDGIVFDLGVSTHQLKTASRGFGFALDGNLDMRMSQSTELTAADIVNKYSADKLIHIIREYGEEREAFRIAKGIDDYRRFRPIKTTGDLSDIIDRSIRSPYKIKAKARVFQALRIYLNGELEVLRSSLYDSVDILNRGGRIAVLSYHSLEDRIVKQIFAEEAKSCVCPPKFPKCICNKQMRLKIITKRPLIPSQEEISVNKSARSAKLRVAERI